MKIKKFFAYGLIAAMLYNIALPSLYVQADQLTSKEDIIYQEMGYKFNILTDNSEKRVVEETETSTGEVTTYTFNKLDKSLTIERTSGTTVFSEQDLISIAYNELNSDSSLSTFASAYAGFGSIGYNYGNGNYFAKITSNGRVYTKNKRSNQVNMGYFYAFKDRVDTIRNLEYDFVRQVGWSLLGVLISGGTGALLAAGNVSYQAIQIGQSIQANTNSAKSYYWNI